MVEYYYKQLRGSNIEVTNLRLCRAKSIYKASQNHNYVKYVSCRRSSQGDEIIFMTLDIEVPDLKVNDIREFEDVAIVCNKSDMNWPEVYALRSDFPLGLSHSNARLKDRPVSLCVSDLDFSDFKLRFNGHQFIEMIRTWLAKTSTNELHEPDRPQEIYFAFNEISCSSFDVINKQYKYVNKVQRANSCFVIKSSTVDESEFLLERIVTQPLESGFINKVPQKIGDLFDIKIKLEQNGIIKLSDIMCNFFMPYRYREKEVNKRLMVFIIVQTYRTGKTDDKSITGYIMSTKKKICDIQSLAKNSDNFKDLLANEEIEFSLLHSDLDLPGIRLAYNGLKESVNKLTIIGVGSLGSQILDQVVRSGYASSVNIVDNDILLPHNLARHVLSHEHIMYSKVHSLTDKYRQFGGIKITPFQKDFIKSNESDIDAFFKNSNMVVDCSTSLSVERCLALDYNKYKVPRCSIFLNPKGNSLVVFKEDIKREQTLDLLEMDYYYSIIHNDNLETHLEIPDTQKYSTSSCRSISNIINVSDINTLASIATRQLGKMTNEQSSVASIWHINEDLSISKCNIIMPRWRTYKVGEVTLRITENLYKEIQEQREQKLSPPKPVETGGTFIGSYDVNRHIIYIVDLIPCPEDSIEKQYEFIRGKKNLLETLEKIKKRTSNQILYLGEWHSHPHNVSNNPSETDLKLFHMLSNEMERIGCPFVMGIINDEDISFRISGI